MSSKYSLNKTKTQTINPEPSLDLQATLHIQRMQNLLEEYEHENRFLNKQIIGLVDMKKTESSTLNQDRIQKLQKHHYGSHLRNHLIVDPPAKKLPLTRNTGSKKKYQYVDEGDLYQPITATYDRYRSSSSKKFSQNRHSTPSKKFESIFNNLHSNESSNTKYNLVSKTEKARPFNYQDQDEHIPSSIIKRYVKQSEENEVEGKTTIDVNAIQKRQSYVRESKLEGSSLKNNPQVQPEDHSQSRSMRQSMRSSRKSGIKVVSSEKDILKNNKSEDQSPRKSKQKEADTKYQQPSPPKQVQHQSFIEQKNQIQFLPTPVSQYEQTFHKKDTIMRNQNQVQVRKQLFSAAKTSTSGPLEKQFGESTQIGINFKINIQMQQPISLRQNRSSSLHRIAPSVKIIFSSDSVQLLPKSTQKSFKGSSKQKKKFINVVSSNLVAQKLRK